MRTRTRKSLALVGAAAALSIALSGCSAIDGLLNGKGQDADRDKSGNVKEDAEIGIFNLKVGDCVLADANQNGEMSSANVTPCDKPHDQEVYFEFDMTGDTYPADDAFQEAAAAQCIPAFEKFVGHPFDGSALDIRTMTPTPDTWNKMNDRKVQCIIVDLNGAKLEGSMKGKAI
ncbi:septum formation family protein [Microbacterium sp.]|uniref:septum formation family protein n=1 Tax=Microbacterium sp. TaxID=51671 RepID=UPI0033420CC0